MNKEWPHTCNLCGAPALQLFSSFECSRFSCKNAGAEAKSRQKSEIDELVRALCICKDCRRSRNE